MRAKAYIRHVQESVLTSPYVVQSNLAFDEISENICYIRGSLTLVDNLQLHIAEYVITEPVIKRLKYRYHLQTVQNKFIARWDNANHHPEIETHPHHLHLTHGNIVPTPAMNIEKVLSAIPPFLS